MIAGCHIGSPTWFLRLAGGQMTGNITMAGAQTVDGVDISALAANVAKIKVGTYTGDGAATKAINGVGFEPDAVIVGRLVAGNAAVGVWMRGMAAQWSLILHTYNYCVDHIRGVGADGFSVGDGTGDQNRLNVLNDVYTYIALKATV